MKEKLHLIAEKFPHYTKQEKDFPGRYYYSFTDEASEAVYQKMVDRLLRAAGEKRFFSLMRVCHGEFILCVGRWLPKGLKRRVKFYIKSCLMELGVLPKIDYGGGLADGTSREKISKKDFQRIRDLWVSAMRDLSRNGMIAAAFNDRTSYVENIDKMFKFFAANDIVLDESNYAPFFGVYGFLAGPDLPRLVGGRNAVAVTWLNEDRRTGIERFLREAGAKNVEFIAVSPHSAVFETIDPSKLEHEPEVVFFACGLGSAPLIHQFRNTSAVCIDAGFGMDLFANPALRGKRAWTLPDHLYDAAKAEATA